MSFAEAPPRRARFDFEIDGNTIIAVGKPKALQVGDGLLSVGWEGKPDDASTAMALANKAGFIFVEREGTTLLIH